MEKIPKELHFQIFSLLYGRDFFHLEQTSHKFKDLLISYCTERKKDLALWADVPISPSKVLQLSPKNNQKLLDWLRAHFFFSSQLRLFPPYQNISRIAWHVESDYSKAIVGWLAKNLDFFPNLVKISISDDYQQFHGPTFKQNFRLGWLECCSRYSPSIDQRFTHFKYQGHPIEAHVSDLMHFLRTQDRTLLEFYCDIKGEALYQVLGWSVDCCALESLHLNVFGTYPGNWAYNIGVSYVRARGLKKLWLTFADNRSMRHIDRHRLKRISAGAPNLKDLFLDQPMNSQDLECIADWDLEKLGLAIDFARISSRCADFSQEKFVQYLRQKGHLLKEFRLRLVCGGLERLWPALLEHLPQIRALDLHESQCPLTPEMLTQLLASCKHLELLVLSELPNFSLGPVKVIVRSPPPKPQAIVGTRASLWKESCFNSNGCFDWPAEPTVLREGE